MAKTFMPKSRSDPYAPKDKACLKCGLVKPLLEFYINKDWAKEYGHDAWCKDCVNDCKTLDDIKEYFFCNNRKWDEMIWTLSCKKAGRALEKDSMTYVKATDGKKKEMEELIASKYVPGVMNLRYFFFDSNTNPNDSTTSFTEQANEKIKQEEKNTAKEQAKMERERIYSELFNGYFNKRDLEYLNEHYKKLNEDFSFDNESTKDYARKVCKASLQFDKAQNDYAMGRCALSDVSEAMNLFDTLSKSANFAACKRKQKLTAGITGWAETTFYLLTNGYLKHPNTDWEEDWVDKTLNEYRNSILNLRLDLV